MFTIFRVLADYTAEHQPGNAVIGPGWACDSLTDARSLRDRLQRRTDLCNIRIKADKYGY